MRTFTIQGIILKRINIGEADRILTVFTKEFGKLKIKAKGVRKITSKRSSHIEPLNVVTLTIYKNLGMPILTEANSIEQFENIKSDLKKVGLAYHICELIDNLCPENQESETIFSLLGNMLGDLSLNKNIEPVIHDFELNLLNLLGYYTEGSLDLRGAKASYYIETILEKKLKTRQILLHLNS